MIIKDFYACEFHNHYHVFLSSPWLQSLADILTTRCSHWPMRTELILTRSEILSLPSGQQAPHDWIKQQIQDQVKPSIIIYPVNPLMKTWSHTVPWLDKTSCDVINPAGQSGCWTKVEVKWPLTTGLSHNKKSRRDYSQRFTGTIKPTQVRCETLLFHRHRWRHAVTDTKDQSRFQMKVFRIFLFTRTFYVSVFCGAAEMVLTEQHPHRRCRPEWVGTYSWGSRGRRWRWSGNQPRSSRAAEPGWRSAGRVEDREVRGHRDRQETGLLVEGLTVSVTFTS